MPVRIDRRAAVRLDAIERAASPGRRPRGRTSSRPRTGRPDRMRPSFSRLPRPSGSSWIQSRQVPPVQVEERRAGPRSRRAVAPGVARQRHRAGSPGQRAAARRCPSAGSKRWTARPSMSTQYRRASGALQSGHSPSRARPGRTQRRGRVARRRLSSRASDRETAQVGDAVDRVGLRALRRRADRPSAIRPVRGHTSRDTRASSSACDDAGDVDPALARAARTARR